MMNSIDHLTGGAFVGKGVHSDQISMEESIAHHRSLETSQLRTKTQESLMISHGNLLSPQHKLNAPRPISNFRSISSSSSNSSNGSIHSLNSSSDKNESVYPTKSTTIGLSRVLISFISDQKEELFLTSITQIVLVSQTWMNGIGGRNGNDSSNTDNTIEFSIGDIQLDNMTDNCPNQVLMASTFTSYMDGVTIDDPRKNQKRNQMNQKKTNSEQQVKKKIRRPFLQLSMVKPFVSNEMDFFSSISVKCQEFEIIADRTILEKHLKSIVMIVDIFQQDETSSGTTINNRKLPSYGKRAGTEVLSVNSSDGSSDIHYVGVRSSGLFLRALNRNENSPIIIHRREHHSSNTSNKRLYIQRLHLHPLSFRFSFGGTTLMEVGHIKKSSESQSEHRRRRKGIGDEESILSKWKTSSSFMSGIFTLVDVDTDLLLGECKCLLNFFVTIFINFILKIEN